MIRLCRFILPYTLIFPVGLALAQSHIGPRAQFYLGEKTSFFSGGEMNLEGALENEGVLVLNGDVHFYENEQAGNLVFQGSSDQRIIGNMLSASAVELQSNGNVLLLASRLESESLTLDQGILHAYDPGSLVVRNGHAVQGGSSQSHVQGYLQLQSTSNDPLHYPMGVDGRFSQISLESVVEGSAIEITAQKPVGMPVPSDSLVGISDKVEWIINQSISPQKTAISLTLDEIDVEGISIQNEIRAENYRPVIAVKEFSAEKFRPLNCVVGEGDASGRTTGILKSSEQVSLANEPVSVAIGLLPEGGPYFYLPNAFTPGGFYEENRVFRPFFEGVLIQSIEMVIWDRFNNEVYRVNQPEPDLSTIGWDGLVNGIEAPEAIYYYQVKLDTDLGLFSEKGTVVLLR